MKSLFLFQLNMHLFAKFNLAQTVIFNRITERLLKKTIPMFSRPEKERRNMGTDRSNNAC